MLTAFSDPATGEPRLVSGFHDVRVWNPAWQGGAAIEAESEGHSGYISSLVATFTDPATARAAGRDRVYWDKTIRVWTRTLAVRWS